MTTLLLILGGCVAGLVVGLAFPESFKPKEWKPKKKGFFDSFKTHHYY